jgi:hypothetical protein
MLVPLCWLVERERRREGGKYIHPSIPASWSRERERERERRERERKERRKVAFGRD